MQLLSTEAETQLINELSFKILSKVEEMTEEKKEVPDIMNKAELCKYLNIANNSFDDYLAAEMPFIRIGRNKRYLKKEVDRFLLSKLETIV